MSHKIDMSVSEQSVKMAIRSSPIFMSVQNAITLQTPASTVQWGDITGNILNQTDLITMAVTNFVRRNLTINGKPLTNNISLSYSDVNALSSGAPVVKYDSVMSLTGNQKLNVRDSIGAHLFNHKITMYNGYDVGTKTIGTNRSFYLEAYFPHYGAIEVPDYLVLTYFGGQRWIPVTGYASYSSTVSGNIISIHSEEPSSQIVTIRFTNGQKIFEQDFQVGYAHEDFVEQII